MEEHVDRDNSGYASTNGTFDNHTVEPFEFGAEQFVVPVLFGAIFIAGFFGNGTLMYIVARNKSMRNVPNMFIFSLALGDFMLILTSVPMSATLYTVYSWPYGWFMCKLNNYLQTLSLIVTVFTLTALSVERFMAISKPMAKRLGDPKRSTMLVACGIWVLGFALAIPDALSANLKTYYDEASNTSIDNCYNYKSDWETYKQAAVTVKFVLLFLVPLVVITSCYVCMAVALITSGQRMPGEEHGNASHRKMIAARRKVAVIVLSFSVLFFVCWMPRYVFLMWFHFNDGDFNAFWFYFKLAGFALAFLNSCVNPVALYFLSAQFRNYYHLYLCWSCRQRRRADSEQTSTMYQFNSGIRRNSTTMSAVQTQC